VGICKRYHSKEVRGPSAVKLDRKKMIVPPRIFVTADSKGLPVKLPTQQEYIRHVNPSHDRTDYICCTHGRVGHPPVLSQARGPVQKWADTELIDVICLFTSDWLDLTEVKKIHRFNGQILDAVTEIKSDSWASAAQRVSNYHCSLTMAGRPALCGAGTEWLFVDKRRIKLQSKSRLGDQSDVSSNSFF
jgi:hypothetical protein